MSIKDSDASPECTECPACGSNKAILVVCCPQCKEEICYNGPEILSDTELLRLRTCEAELRMIHETARAWIAYKGFEYKGSNDHYADYVINCVLRGEKPGV